MYPVQRLPLQKLSLEPVQHPITYVDIRIEDPLIITGVGDIMLGTYFPNTSYLPPDSGRGLLDPVAGILLSSDVTFGNLEGVIFDGEGTPKSCSDPSICYLFKSPEYMATHLADAGFDMMSLANNHAGDFGNEGRAGTQRALARHGIAYAGLLDTTYTVIRRKGRTIGMVAFSPNTGTVSIHDYDAAFSLISKVDTLCDVLIVSFHGGAEGADNQHIPRQTEYYYGENRGNVYEFAHKAIDHGADVVFGHGPHVSRAIEVYQNRFIAYSLGNFCTYGRFNLRGEAGVAPIIQVKTSPQGIFLEGQIYPIKQPGPGGPVPDQDMRAVNIIRSLTEKDFPEGDLYIEETGKIMYLWGK